MTQHKFAAFILTHGRPDKQYTATLLRKSGYTGKIYYVVDDMDKTKDEYVTRYGSDVILFSKKEARKYTDQGDNSEDHRSVVYARNFSTRYAKEIGLDFFLQLDDDYYRFSYRFNSNFDYCTRQEDIKSLDKTIEVMVKFLDATGATSVAMSQGGDFIGGEECKCAQNVLLLRKCMNFFVCSTKKPFDFMCKMNDDVTTYCSLGSRGNLFFTLNQISLNQKETQQNTGGMTEIYLDQGTYVKSFFSVMFNPSSVKVSVLRSNNQRIHHQVMRNNTVPKILAETHKK